jgi:hypothetical protein
MGGAGRVRSDQHWGDLSTCGVTSGNRPATRDPPLPPHAPSTLPLAHGVNGSQLRLERAGVCRRWHWYLIGGHQPGSSAEHGDEGQEEEGFLLAGCGHGGTIGRASLPATIATAPT